jgi:hypothetical protein
MLPVSAFGCNLRTRNLCRYGDLGEFRIFELLFHLVLLLIPELLSKIDRKCLLPFCNVRGSVQFACLGFEHLVFGLVDVHGLVDPLDGCLVVFL